MINFSSSGGEIHLRYIDSETDEICDRFVDANEALHLKYVDPGTNKTHYCIVKMHQVSASLLDGKIRKVVQIFLPKSPKVEAEPVKPRLPEPSRRHHSTIPLQASTQHSMISTTHKVGLLITGILLLTVIVPFFLQPGSWPFYAVVGFGMTDCLIFSGLLIALVCKSKPAQIPREVQSEPKTPEPVSAEPQKQPKPVAPESLREERFELDIRNSGDLDLYEIHEIDTDSIIVLSDLYLYNLRAETDFAALSSEFEKALRDSSGPYTRQNYTIEDSKLFDRAKARLGLWKS